MTSPAPLVYPGVQVIVEPPPVVEVTVEPPDEVIVLLAEFGLQGVRGPQGEQGIQGPQGERGADGVSIKGDKGDSGGFAVHYVLQPVLEVEWAHGLPYKPAVTVLDSAGFPLGVPVEYPTEGTVRVRFGHLFTGELRAS